MKKNILKLLSPVSVFFPQKSLISITKQKLILPFYHTVCNEELPHLKHLYPVRNEKLFRRDLDFFLKHYKPISLSDLIKISKGEAVIEKPSFFLSFDDGLSEIYHVAAPILKEKGVPATFFITTEFINNKSLFYRHKASVMIEALKDMSLNDSNDLANSVLKGIGLKKLSALMINTDDSFITKIAAMLKPDIFSNYLKKAQPYLTTLQIESLLKDGFDIGSHGTDHTNYKYLELSQQIKQTTISIQNLYKKFNVPVCSFAFPFTDSGIKSEFFEAIYSLKKSKVEISFGGAGLKHDSFKNHFQRIPMERTLLPAKNIIRAEYLYYIIKAPFGRNTINRI